MSGGFLIILSMNLSIIVKLHGIIPSKSKKLNKKNDNDTL